MNVELTLLTGENEEMTALQEVLENAPAYAEAVTGGPPGAADAESLFSALQTGGQYDDKFVWGFLTDGTMVGCANVIRVWPETNTAQIGLLLLDEAHRGHGGGRLGYEAVETQIRQWRQTRAVRAAVVATNLGSSSLASAGLPRNGQVKPSLYDKLVSETIILTKRR